jgi:hypothetical protein
MDANGRKSPVNHRPTVWTVDMAEEFEGQGLIELT